MPKTSNELAAAAFKSLEQWQAKGYFVRVWIESDVAQDRIWHVTLERGTIMARCECDDLCVAIAGAVGDADRQEQSFGLGRRSGSR